MWVNKGEFTFKGRVVVCYPEYGDKDVKNVIDNFVAEIKGTTGIKLCKSTPKKEKLENLIAEFSLEKVRKNLGDQLSGGERRRTEIARCLAISPKFIMLDEPFAGVDPIAVEEIQSVVYKLKEKNIGIVFGIVKSLFVLNL